MKIAIIGAGWGGMAAAVQAAQDGHAITVFEAARTVGGRARALPLPHLPHLPNLPLDDGTTLTLDNGQHILIGAYTECLRLMRTLGVDPDTALLRMPLALVFPDGTGLRLPNLPPPLDALLGIAQARGWTLGERWALLRRAAQWRLQGFVCAPQASVADICSGLPMRLMEEFIDPLCVSALNTPAAQSSGQVFLRVLHDSLFAGRGGSNLLLPRTDLGTLLPQTAAHWLVQRGHLVHLGHRVQQLQAQGAGWSVDGEPFDAVLLACSSTEAARLVASSHPAWANCAQALTFSAIATVYARVPHTHGPCLPLPMLALRSSAAQPAQFVFDRAHLDGHNGLLAFVVSAFEGTRAQLENQVRAQAAQQLDLHHLELVQTVVEKRATFRCTPGLKRPAMHIAPGLMACADYVDGPYPATLEGAVRHGLAAAAALAPAAPRA